MRKAMESRKVADFLSDVHEVCKKHGFCIEVIDDSQGGFVIGRYDDESDFEWLGSAFIGSTITELGDRSAIIAE